MRCEAGFSGGSDKRQKLGYRYPQGMQPISPHGGLHLPEDFAKAYRALR